MKSCPTCNRTFEDTLTYCLIDGSILSAPFDPHATLIIPEPRQTEPPPTEVLPVEEIREEITPTISSPQPPQKEQELVSTIAAPVLESPQIKASPAQPVRKSNRRLWVIGGILVLVLAGVGLAIMLRKAAIRRAAEQQTIAVAQHTAAASKLKDEKKYVEAEAEYRQVLKLDPDNDAAHISLYLMLEEQQRYAEAEAEIREAVRLRPKNSFYHEMFAETLETNKKYAEAEGEYRELIRLSINHPPAQDKLPQYYWELGTMLEQQKKYPEAEAEYREALRLKPDDSIYQDYLKRVLAAQGK